LFVSRATWHAPQTPELRRPGHVPHVFHSLTLLLLLRGPLAPVIALIRLWAKGNPLRGGHRSVKVRCWSTQRSPHSCGQAFSQVSKGGVTRWKGSCLSAAQWLRDCAGVSGAIDGLAPRPWRLSRGCSGRGGGAGG